MKKSLILTLSIIAGTLLIPVISTYAVEYPGEEYCFQNPEDPSCLDPNPEGEGEPPFCDLYPDDPSCTDPDDPDYCDYNPDAPTCVENPDDPGEQPSTTDPYTENFQLSTFSSAISSMLPIVGVAVLVGFLFYVIRWAISMFRGV